MPPKSAKPAAKKGSGTPKGKGSTKVKKEEAPEPQDDEDCMDQEPESDSEEESSGSESASDGGAKKKKKGAPAKQSKNKKESAGGAGKKRRRKSDEESANMAYNKGEYILRLTDVDENKVQVWRVDNYQLLQKYVAETDGDTTKYVRTQYYTGWQCHQKWKFLPCQVVNMERQNGREEKVEIRWFSQEELAQAQKEAAAKGDE